MSSALLLLAVCLTAACSSRDSPPATTTTAPAASTTAIVANAGPNQSALVNAFITLNGIQSFSTQNTVLTYSWALRMPAGSSAKLSNPTAVDPTLTVDLAGTYEATLIVNDGKQTSAPDTVLIAVGTTNAPPAAVITSNSSQVLHVTYNQPVTLDGKDSNDQNHDLLNFKWTVVKPNGSVLPSDQLALSNTAAPVFTPDVQGPYTVQLVVNDGTVDSASAQITVSAEDKPGPTADAGPVEQTFTLSVETDTEVALNGIGSTQLLNGDGSLTTTSAGLTYQWVITPISTQTLPLESSPPIIGPTNLDKASASFKVPAKESGRYKAELTVTEPTHPDQAKRIAIDSILIKVAPIAVAGADQTVKAGATVTLDGSGSLPKSTAPNYLSLTYQWTIFSSCPLLCTQPIFTLFSTSPTIEFTTSTLADQIYTATLGVKDSLGHLSAPDQVLIFTKPGPIITGITMYPAFISPSNQSETSVTVGDSSPPMWSFPTGTFVKRDSLVTATASLSGIIGNPTCLWESLNTAVDIKTPPSCTSATFGTSVAGEFTLRLTVTDTLTDGSSLKTSKEFAIRVATPPTIILTPKIVTPEAGTNNETTSNLDLTSTTEPTVCRKVTIDAAVSGTTIQPTWAIIAPTPPGRRRNTFPNDVATDTSTDGYRSTVNNSTIGVRLYDGTPTVNLDTTITNPAAFKPTTGTAQSSSQFRPDVPGDFVVTASVTTPDTLTTQASVTLTAKSQNSSNLDLHTTLLNLRNSTSECGSCHKIGMWNYPGGSISYPDHSGRGLALFSKFNADGSVANHSNIGLPTGRTREEFCALFNDLP